ncbi:MAG: T9SS type A sorting domain-containing protein [Lewinellaceae bacterium]|nr:T9SS type A sorting domain-containing protein [Saprospiraceae bacterium]MCB9314137.1 T9SS type A sorting domain-containing protein [Lewinellaceae bacterium]
MIIPACKVRYALVFMLFFINGVLAQTGSWAYDHTYFDRGMMMEMQGTDILINAQTYSIDQPGILTIYNLLINPDDGSTSLIKGIEIDSHFLQIDRGLEFSNSRYYNSGGMNSYKTSDSSIFKMMIAVFDEDLDTVRMISFRDSTLTSFGRDVVVKGDKLYLWGNSGVGFSTLFNVLVSLDTTGHVLWYQRYKDDYQFLNPAFIEEAHDKQLIATSMGQRYQEKKTIVVRKIDTLGATIWKRDLGWNGVDDNSCLAKLGSDKYLVTSFKDTVYNGPGEQLVAYPSWIFILDEDGKIIHDTILGVPAQRRYNKAVSTADGGALLVGYFILPFSQVAVMTKFDSLGHVHWDRYYRDMDRTTKVGSNDYRFVGGFFDAEVLPDGRIAACGMVTDSFTSGANNIWLVVLDSVGCWMPGCEDGLQNTIITHITQEQQRLPIRVFPNPSSGIITISSSLTETDPEGTLEVFNVQGRLIHLQQGLQPIQVMDLSHLPPGMYTIRLMTRAGYAVERLVLER